MIKNKDEFIKHLGLKAKVAESSIQKAMFRSHNLVRNTAVDSILRGAKSGSIVQKYNPRRTHQQSRPGEPPASDTGFLAANIGSRTVTEGAGENKVFVGQVYATAEYAKHLEYGTVNMEARPFLRPALRQNADKIRSIFVKEGIIT